MASNTTLKMVMVLSGTVLLAGCDDTKLPAFMQNSKTSVDGDSPPPSRKVRSVERDVEAPEVFQVAEGGLWDGRPSLGGVWVAHPTATDPERVIIRNNANGKFVIGALFRRERANPGPRFQVSSDAASVLGMLAGAPAELSVTALRTETVEEVDETANAPTEELEAPEEIKQGSLDDPNDPIAAATAALDNAEGVSATATAAPDPKPTAAAASKPTPAATATSTGLAKPYVQIGIFSVEANAKNTAEAMRKAGMAATIKPGKSKGKSFWRVIVGPAKTSAERGSLLNKIKGLGFADAYFVSK